MYSLGCLIYAVHCKGNPPFRNHGNLAGVRDNAGRPVPDIGQLDTDLQGHSISIFSRDKHKINNARCYADLLRSLITRGSPSRPTPSTLPSYSFFSSLPISTLNFLDRSNFTAKTREEKISFMRGLTSVLERFSEGLRTRKILPSLLEEVRAMFNVN
jgi:SCY1-like protein 2